MLASDIVGLLILREEVTSLGQQSISTKKIIQMIDKVNGAMTRTHFQKELLRARAAMASQSTREPVRSKRKSGTAPIITEESLVIEDEGADDPEPGELIPAEEESVDDSYEEEEEAPKPKPKKKKAKSKKTKE